MVECSFQEAIFQVLNILTMTILEKLLQKKRGEYNRALIVSESVFSMDGDVADIDRLVELKNKYNCLLMIDEAHAFACYGDTLAGVSFGKDVDIITGNFWQSGRFVWCILCCKQ